MTAESNPPMLSIDEIRRKAITSEVAKEALVQSEKYLTDLLEIKKSVEQKATVLFGAYVTISLALFGFGAKDLSLIKATPFFLAGMFFVAGASAFCMVLTTAKYGMLGSKPSLWLQPGRIDGDKTEIARMMAYLTYYHGIRIDRREASNKDKKLVAPLWHV